LGYSLKRGKRLKNKIQAVSGTTDQTASFFRKKLFARTLVSNYPPRWQSTEVFFDASVEGGPAQ
jgi:hypothetical protein